LKLDDPFGADPGVEALIAVDPNAYWDEASNSIKGSDFDVTPR
jgi:hypothetical protein